MSSMPSFPKWMKIRGEHKRRPGGGRGRPMYSAMGQDDLGLRRGDEFDSGGR